MIRDVHSRSQAPGAATRPAARAAADNNRHQVDLESDSLVGTALGRNLGCGQRPILPQVATLKIFGSEDLSVMLNVGGPCTQEDAKEFSSDTHFMDLPLLNDGPLQEGTIYTHENQTILYREGRLTLTQDTPNYGFAPFGGGVIGITQTKLEIETDPDLSHIGKVHLEKSHSHRLPFGRFSQPTVHTDLEIDDWSNTDDSLEGQVRRKLYATCPAAVFNPNEFA